jgi:hypothetical protein
MIHGDLFDKLADIACSLKNAVPFGGIQVEFFSCIRNVSHT